MIGFVTSPRARLQYSAGAWHALDAGIVEENIGDYKTRLN